MSKLDMFNEYLNTQVTNHSIYVFGAQGEGKNIISESWIRKMETTPKNADRAIAHWKKEVAAGYGDVLRAFDCSGLGMCELAILFGFADTTADGMFKKYTKEITRSQLRNGDWVGKKNSQGVVTHIGYIVDNDLNVVECKGRDDGCVKRPLSSGNWNHYGRPTIFDEEGDTCMTELPVLKKGMRDTNGAVTSWQCLLHMYGYRDDSGEEIEIDGYFWSRTEQATKKAQKKHGLPQTGVVDADTWKYLII